MSLPRYSRYKDSGVVWLGDVPEHWEVRRLQDIADIVNGYPFDSKLFERDGEYPLIRIRDLNSAESATRYSGEFLSEFAITSHDVLIGMDGDFSVGRWLGNETALLNQRVCCVRTDNSALSTLLLHALPLPLKPLNEITYSTTVKHLSSLDVQKLRFALPPDNEELAAIAEYLSREINKIDRLIGAQQELLELLSEKRQATILRSVTQGINCKAAMRDSGLPWLGEIPEHWTVCTVRRLVSYIEQGWSPECINRPADTSEWGVLKAGCVNGGKFNPNENKALPETLSPDETIEVHDGDLLMSRASGSPSLVGSIAYLSMPPPRLMLSDKIFRIHLKPNASPRFFAAAFETRYLRQQIEQAISGAEGLANNLTQASLKSITIALPPINEQLDIAAFIKAEISRLTGLAVEAEHAIALLKERRIALISAAVTGQINVRNVMPQSTPK